VLPDPDIAFGIAGLALAVFIASFVSVRAGEIPTPPIARALQLTAPFVPKELARTWLSSGSNSRLFEAYPFVRDAYLRRAYPPARRNTDFSQ
jgi:hypothetical protein